MSHVSKETYDRIDNDLYNRPSDIWWNPDEVLYLLKSSINPVRVGYTRRKIFEELKWNPQGKKALEVGSGGGILAEETARMGFETWGIDPSASSVKTAGEHARQSGLNISFSLGTGEAIPFDEATFDAVFCCDVLEHIRDLPKVIAEIWRVLKPGGIFCFDTINRTFVSKLVAIKIWQEWKRWAFLPPNLHVSEMFIKPDELKAHLLNRGLKFKEFHGTEPNVSIPKMLSYLHKRTRGEWTYREFGENFRLVESDDKNILYMSWAVKK